MRSLERAVRAVIRVMTRGAGMRLGGGTLRSLAILCAALVGWVALLPALMGPPVRPVVGDPARGSATTATYPDRAGRGTGAPAADGSGVDARGPDPSATGPPGSDLGAGDVTESPVGGQTTAIDKRALSERLVEILRARERAYALRDATVLDTVYTVDCPCLRTGRAAIARLRADDAVWLGRSFSLRVERLSRVNDSLWIAIAVLRWDSFRIEREDGGLVRAVPAARERYRFALVRPAGSADWLLGHASLVEELPP
jgi:hypothetical protein